jgi:hypothetical protein
MDRVARKPLEAASSNAAWAAPAAEPATPDYEAHEAFMPQFPLCRIHSEYGASSSGRQDTEWDRECTKLVRTHAGMNRVLKTQIRCMGHITACLSKT